MQAPDQPEPPRVLLLQALDRPEPPPFPLAAALLPACRQRVKLAVRLDAILREQSKAHAGGNSLLPSTCRCCIAGLPCTALDNDWLLSA